MSYFWNAKAWPELPLQDISTLKRGYDLPVGQRQPGAVPIYAANGVNGSHNEVKITAPGVITGRSGTIGKVHYTDDDYWPLNTALYVTNFHDNHPKWVYYMLQSFKLERFVEGAGVPTLNRNLVHGELIPLPPLPEQIRIAAILDKADAIRRKRQQAIELADEFLRSVFLDMFGDPVTNPKGFDLKPITDFASIITGNAFKSNEYIEDGQDAVRLCRGVNTSTGYFSWKDTAFWSKHSLKDLDGYLLKCGDIILAMDRPWISSGIKAAMWGGSERDTYLVQRVARLRTKKDIYRDFILAVIKSNAFEKHCCPTETTVPHISPVELKNFMVPYPGENTLQKFHKLTSKVRSSVKFLEQATDYSDHFFKALSQRAFAGEL